MCLFCPQSKIKPCNCRFLGVAGNLHNNEGGINFRRDHIFYSIN